MWQPGNDSHKHTGNSRHRRRRLRLISPLATAVPATDSASPTVASPTSETTAVANTYPIVDTAQGKCYDDSAEITLPLTSFSGQDAQYTGNQPSYTNNGDGTITDNVTGLIWQKSPDTNGDGSITATDKLGILQSRRLL